MEFVFVDDARQNKPSRPGVDPLVAIGGVLIADEAVQELEKEIDKSTPKPRVGIVGEIFVRSNQFARRAIPLPLYSPVPLTMEAVSPHKHSSSYI